MKLGSKRVDQQELTNATQNDVLYIRHGIVRAVDGEHYQIYEREGKRTDILIGVELTPTGELITPKLGTVLASRGQGMWKIPPIGTEVVVAFPDGDFTYMPYVISIGPSNDPDGNAIPEELDEDTLVISNDKATIVASSDGNITINAKSGNVVINASEQVKINGEDKQVAFKDGKVDCGSLLVVTTAPIGVASIAYVPDGYGPLPVGGALIPMNNGIIVDGSSKAKVGV